MIRVNPCESVSGNLAAAAGRVMVFVVRSSGYFSGPDQEAAGRMRSATAAAMAAEAFSSIKTAR